MNQPKVTLRDLFHIEAAKLTPIAAHWGMLAERAKVRATDEGDPKKVPSMWAIHSTFTAASWLLMGVHNLLTDAARTVGE